MRATSHITRKVVQCVVLIKKIYIDITQEENYLHLSWKLKIVLILILKSLITQIRLHVVQILRFNM